jgi:hypothetical protein
MYESDLKNKRNKDINLPKKISSLQKNKRKSSLEDIQENFYKN